MKFEGKKYSEINDIHNFLNSNDVTIETILHPIISDSFVPLKLKIQNQFFIIQVNDEYNDLDNAKPLLNFVLVFRELELLNEATDYLDWCKQQSVDANNNLLINYYKNIIRVITNINSCFPDSKVTSFVSDLDFQLNSGVMQYLRRKDE